MRPAPGFRGLAELHLTFPAGRLDWSLAASAGSSCALVQHLPPRPTTSIRTTPRTGFGSHPSSSRSRPPRPTTALDKLGLLRARSSREALAPVSRKGATAEPRSRKFHRERPCSRPWWPWRVLPTGCGGADPSDVTLIGSRALSRGPPPPSLTSRPNIRHCCDSGVREKVALPSS